jgi:septum formation protein
MSAPSLVLASTSRYRSELLARLQVPFTTADPGVDEAAFKKTGLAPRPLAERLAFEKASAVQKRFPDAVIIGGDQLVALGDESLGKPGSPQGAVEQLLRLAGREHTLITALVVLHRERAIAHTDITRLRVRPLDRAAIERYVAVDNPVDCAGSYKIESLGIALFAAIETGDPTAIQGLPLLAVAGALTTCGIAIP